MTSDSGLAPQPSPWLSVWIAPRATIGRLVAADPRRHVLLLAALSMLATILAQSIGRDFTSQLFDPAVFVIIVVAGGIFGIIDLYVFGFFLTWSGKLLRGRATPAQARAALAWGAAPTLISLVVCLAALLGLKLAGTAATGSFAATLNVALPVLAGLLNLWALLNTVAMIERVQGFGALRATVNLVLAFAISLLLAILFRTFLFQPFSIPSQSMVPTLLEGDQFVVSKFAYGYTHYSLPFSPRLFSGRMLSSEPKRGDVVVFRLPKDDATDYVKRVVGLPGDRIQMINGILHINKRPVLRERIADFEIDGRSGKRWRETLPNDVSYETLDLEDRGLLDNTLEYNVPAGHYFMLGDNRDNSSDSRVASQVGTIPLENIVGRAVLIYFSTDRNAPQGRSPIRYDRLGMILR